MSIFPKNVLAAMAWLLYHYQQHSLSLPWHLTTMFAIVFPSNNSVVEKLVHKRYPKSRFFALAFFQLDPMWCCIWKLDWQLEVFDEIEVNSLLPFPKHFEDVVLPKDLEEDDVDCIFVV